MWILPNQTYSARQIFKHTFEFWKLCWIRVMPITFLSAAVIVFMNAILPPPHVQPQPLQIITILILVLLRIVFLAAMLDQIYKIMQNQPNSLISGIKYGIKKFPIFLLASILLIVSTLAGTLLFIFPGIYIMVVLFLLFPALVMEKKGIIDTYKNVFKLTWGHWWHTAITIMVPIIVFMAVVNLIHGLVNLGLKLIGQSGLMLLENPFVILAAIFFMPYITSIFFLCLNDLELRKRK